MGKRKGAPRRRHRAAFHAFTLRPGEKKIIPTVLAWLKIVTVKDWMSPIKIDQDLGIENVASLDEHFSVFRFGPRRRQSLNVVR
jgi:hypothetical protein